jgi:hypothetical protein
MSLDRVIASQDVNAQFVAAASALCDWHGIGGVLYLTEQDAATITNPDSQISTNTGNTARAIFVKDARMGSLIGLRMSYNSGLVGITGPTVKLFGRAPGSTWQLMKTRLGAVSVTLSANAYDIAKASGTTFYTTVDPEEHYFDCQGCTEFLVGVEETISVSSGTITVAGLEIKVI